MNKCLGVAIISFVAGVYVGFTKEDDLEDAYRQSRRMKKKTMKKMHKAYDSACDCMDLD